MEIEDLMTKDWVSFRGRPIRIEEISRPSQKVCVATSRMVAYPKVSEIEPIPLTPEILEKNGFERCVSSIIRTSTAAIPVCNSNQFATADFSELRIIDRGIWHYSLKTPVVCDTKHYEIHEIKYVHELQRALKICHINKEIIM